MKRNKWFILILIIPTSALLILFLTAEKSYQKMQHIPITPEIAGQYALFSMMASNSFHRSDRINFPLEVIDWHRITTDNQPTNKPAAIHPVTGLAYDIYKNRKTGDIVFAFRGTDSKWDYIMANFAIGYSPAYQQAFKEFGQYQQAHPQQHIIVTGHSLGGGIALGVSVRYGVDAVAFDSSPRIFDGLGDHHLPANRVLIYQEKEVLEYIRKKWDKIAQVLIGGRIYKTSFDFAGQGNHRGDLLANALLELGKTSNPKLKILSEKISSQQPKI